MQCNGTTRFQVIRWFLMCVVAIVGVGCGGTTEQPSEPVHVQDAEAQDDPNAVADADEEGADEEGADEEGADEEESVESLELMPAVDEAEVVPESSDPEPRFHRVLLPTPEGPLLVDLRIRVGDQELEDVYNQIVEVVYTDAIDGDDETPSWEDIFELLENDPSRFGELNAATDKQRKELTTTWDRDRDGKPDRSEVARLLFRDVHGYAPFVVQGTDYYRRSGAGSDTFRAMDQNGNRRLDAHEIQNAATSLQSLDRNADQRIALSETLPPVQSMVAGMGSGQEEAWRRHRSRRDGAVAMDFESYVDWEALSYTLSGASKTVAWSSVSGDAKSIHDKIDSDLNERISANEAEQLLTVAADFRLDIQLATNTGQPIVAGPWELAPHHESVEVTQVSPQTLALRGPRLQVLIVTEDHTERDAIWNGQVRCRAAEVPDSIFSWLDQDHDGVLSTREISDASDRLAQCGELPLRPEQIPATFLMFIQRGAPQEVAVAFGSPISNASELASQMPDWFEDLDSNRDGEIARGEFLGTAEQFLSLDQNHDQFLTAEECVSRTGL
jgi:hypothetical protein